MFRPLSSSFHRFACLLPALLITLAISNKVRAASNTWDGGSVTNGNWSNATNWAGDANVPGSGDTATFNAAIANTWGSSGSPIVIDSINQQLKSITFDASSGNYVIGSTGGNALFLASGGIIQMTNALSNTSSETINAPMVIVGADGTYNFANNKNNIASSLILGGSISGGTVGNTVITFDSAQSSSPNVASGVISDGTATTLSLIHSTGTWTYSGNNTYSGSTTVRGGTANLSGTYSGGGALLIQSAATGNSTATVNLTGNANFSGDVALNGLGNTAYLYLGTASAGGGALTAATSVTLNGAAVNYARLTLNNTMGNLDRILDTATVTSGYGLITLTGNATANSTETIGDFVITTGQTSLSIGTATGRVTTLAAASLSRLNQGTLSIIATNLGSTSPNSTKITFATTPLLVGSGGSASGANSGIKNLGILPWVVAGNTAISDFATYDTANGLRYLAASEVQTSIASAAAPSGGQTGDNVKISANSETDIITKTINSLFLAPAATQTITGAGTGNSLTISSGGLAQSAALTSTVSGFDAITFGNGEAVINVTHSSGIVALNSGINVTSGGGLTKFGSGTLILGAANSYSGSTLIQTGILQIGNGGTIGDLGSSSGVSLLRSGTLNYNRTNALTIRNVTGGGTLNNINAAGTLTLNQVGAGLSIGTIGGVSGSTVIFDGTGTTTIGSLLATAGQVIRVESGTVNLASSRNTAVNLEIVGGVVNTIDGQTGLNNSPTQTFTLSGGEFNVLATYGLSGLNTAGSANSGGYANNFTATQTGGLLSIVGDGSNQARFALGSATGGATSSYNLSGGTFSHTGGGSFLIGADTGGTSTATFRLSGGKLITSSTIAGSQASGAKQAFVWTGGTLATAAYNATYLTSTAGQAVSASTNTLTNAGGTLAPGNIGTAGRTTITGNYIVTSADAALAIDVGGTVSTSAFQAASGAYDNVTVSAGAATLNGSLRVSLINGYTPPSNATTLFNILTSSGTGAALSGTFTNLQTATAGNQRVVLNDGLSSFLVAINTTASTATTGGLTNVAARTVALGGYQAVNTYNVASGGAWDQANAASWTAFDAGATASPSTQASGAIAQFADGSGTGTGANLVQLNATRNVQGIQFASAVSGHDYTINNAGAGAIIFDNTGNSANASLADSSANGNTNAVNVPITLRSDLDVSVTNAGTTLLVGGNIGGSGRNLNKSGAGTLVLSGASTYSGATQVNAGKLVVNGSLAAASTVTIASGATLGGSGNIGNLNVLNGGTHAPGNSPGLQTVTGNASYAAGSTFAWELEKNVSLTSLQSGPLYDFDQVQVGGNLSISNGAIFTLTLNGAGSTVDFTDAFWAGNQQWLVMSVQGTGTGDFTLGTITTDHLGQSAATYGTFSLQNSGGDIYLNWTAAAIPEPSSGLLLLTGLAVICGWRRRRVG